MMIKKKSIDTIKKYETNEKNFVCDKSMSHFNNW